MSYHSSIYMGPLLICINPIIDTTVEIRSCPNTKCITYGRLATGEYCYKCGSEIKNVPHIEKKPKISNHSVIEKTNETFCPVDSYENGDKNKVLIVPNKKIKELERETHLYPEDGGFFCDIYESDRFAEIKFMRGNSLKDVDILSEINYMVHHFSKEIDIIKELYGEENVTITWGILNY